MKYPKRIVEKTRSSEAKAMIVAAREAMEKFKSDRKIKAILPKTKNQKLELKRSNALYKVNAAHEMRLQSFGAASKVRKIKVEEKE